MQAYNKRRIHRKAFFYAGITRMGVWVVKGTRFGIHMEQKAVDGP